MNKLTLLQLSLVATGHTRKPAAYNIVKIEGLTDTRGGTSGVKHLEAVFLNKPNVDSCPEWTYLMHTY